MERRVAPILHGDVPTMFEAPLGEPGQAEVALLGVAYEGVKVRDRHTLLPANAGGSPPGSVYFRTGADQAPDAIRRQSVYHSLEHEGGVVAEAGGIVLAERLRIVECGDHDLAGAEAVASAAARGGAITVAAGGDHLVPLPLLRGLQQGRPRRLALFVLDSHYDLHPSPPLWAGSQWLTAFEEGLLAPEHVLIFGQRGVRHSPEEIEAARRLGVTTVSLREYDEGGFRVRRARARPGRGGSRRYLRLARHRRRRSGVLPGAEVSGGVRPGRTRDARAAARGVQAGAARGVRPLLSLAGLRRGRSRGSLRCALPARAAPGTRRA